MVKSYINLYKSYIKHIKVYTKLLGNKQKNLKSSIFVSHVHHSYFWAVFSFTFSAL